MAATPPRRSANSTGTRFTSSSVSINSDRTALNLSREFEGPSNATLVMKSGSADSDRQSTDSESSRSRGFFDKSRKQASERKSKSPEIDEAEAAKRRGQLTLLKAQLSDVRSNLSMLQQMERTHEYSDDGSTLRRRINEKDDQAKALQSKIWALEPPGKQRCKGPAWTMREMMYMHTVGSL